MGGDYNKWMVGFRDYELSVLGASETFVDSMKKLSLGYQFGVEVLYNLSPEPGRRHRGGLPERIGDEPPRTDLA